MELRIPLLTLGVDDLDRSLVFYREGLGLPSEDVTGDVVFFKLQGAWISLYANESLERDAGLGPGVAGFSGMRYVVIPTRNQPERRSSEMRPNAKLESRRTDGQSCQPYCSSIHL
jgi:catechol 2,3-dioxygenase-like lactoylglutathione lyase family enzyme